MESFQANVSQAMELLKILNRILVFQGDHGRKHTLARYYFLALVQMCVSAGLVVLVQLY